MKDGYYVEVLGKVPTYKGSDQFYDCWRKVRTSSKRVRHWTQQYKAIVFQTMNHPTESRVVQKIGDFEKVVFPVERTVEEHLTEQVRKYISELPFDPEAAKFFREHSGWSTPPSRDACARNDARAEKYGQEHEYRFEWKDEEDYYHFFKELEPEDQKKSREESWECLCCLLYVDDSDVPEQSLGAIWEPSKEYRRVVEAELAHEQMYQEIKGRLKDEDLAESFWINA